MSSPNAKASYSLLDRALIWFHRRASHGRRVRTLTDALAPRVPAGATLLDLGCGDLSLAAGLREARRLTRCVGADIWPLRSATPKGCEYLEIRPGPLPFGDKSFDVVLLVDTLHHCDDAGGVLGEALRVGRKVLLKDHFEYGPWSRWVLQALDFVGNYAYGVPVPDRYFTRKSFRALADRLGARCRVDVGVDLYDHLSIMARLAPPELHFIAELES